MILVSVPCRDHGRVTDTIDGDRAITPQPSHAPAP
jgi:hypothetical protein